MVVPLAVLTAPRPCFVPHPGTLTRSARGPASSACLNEAPGADWRAGEGGGVERERAVLGLADE